ACCRPQPGPRSVTEKLGIHYVYAAYCPIFLPSPHHPPTPFPGRPFPRDVTDNRVLWDLNAQSANELFGAALNARPASIGLPRPPERIGKWLRAPRLRRREENGGGRPTRGGGGTAVKAGLPPAEWRQRPSGARRAARESVA